MGMGSTESLGGLLAIMATGATSASVPWFLDLSILANRTQPQNSL